MKPAFCVKLVKVKTGAQAPRPNKAPNESPRPHTHTRRIERSHPTLYLPSNPRKYVAGDDTRVFFPPHTHTHTRARKSVGVKRGANDRCPFFLLPPCRAAARSRKRESTHTYIVSLIHTYVHVYDACRWPGCVLIWGREREKEGAAATARARAYAFHGARASTPARARIQLRRLCVQVVYVWGVKLTMAAAGLADARRNIVFPRALFFGTRVWFFRSDGSRGRLNFRISRCSQYAAGREGFLLHTKWGNCGTSVLGMGKEFDYCRQVDFCVTCVWCAVAILYVKRIFNRGYWNTKSGENYNDFIYMQQWNSGAIKC